MLKVKWLMFNFMGDDWSGQSSVEERTPKVSGNDESNPGSILEKAVHHQKCHRLLEVFF